MAYTDPSTQFEKAYYFFADLDLYVEDKDGKVYVGNIFVKNNDVKYTDSFAAIEKVSVNVEDIKSGTYKVHILSPSYPMSAVVKYSLVITGDFDYSSNPNGRCQRW